LVAFAAASSSPFHHSFSRRRLVSRTLWKQNSLDLLVLLLFPLFLLW
jgi:hypothetical protein